MQLLVPLLQKVVLNALRGAAAAAGANIAGLHLHMGVSKLARSSATGSSSVAWVRAVARRRVAWQHALPAAAAHRAVALADAIGAHDVQNAHAANCAYFGGLLGPRHGLHGCCQTKSSRHLPRHSTHTGQGPSHAALVQPGSARHVAGCSPNVVSVAAAAGQPAQRQPSKQAAQRVLRAARLRQVGRQCADDAS